MPANVEELKRLSALLDDALEVAVEDRGAWLESLGRESAQLAERLKTLLAWQDANPAGSPLDGPPAFALNEANVESEFKADERVGPYRLLRRIGWGGMGEVWLAERADGQLKRAVALKLPVLGGRRKVLVQRFARERDILGGLAHPHIARLYDAGLADGGQPFLALEYVEGRPITAYCDERGLSVRARVDLLRQVMEAVQYAHANLVVHRDLKPSNVLVTAHGQAMLLDFGIAKLLESERGEVGETELTELGGRALTIQYAAPEQITGAPISIATDVWALGVLLYELLTGHRPFEQSTRGAQEDAVLEGEPPRPSHQRTGAMAALPRSEAIVLETVVLKALKKSPRERYATVDAMADDLTRWLDGLPVRAQRPSVWYRCRKTITRNRLASAAVAAVTASVLIGAGVAGWQARLATQSAQVASRESERAQRERDAATAVRDFLIGVFRASDPETTGYAAQQMRSVRDVLTDGIARLHRSMDEQPESKSALYEALVTILINLSEDHAARELAREHVDYVRSRIGAHHERYAVALMQEAEARKGLEDVERARDLVARASAVLDALGDQDSASRARLMILQGTGLGAAGQHEAIGLDAARRGVELLRARGVAPSEQVRALMEIARTDLDLGRFERALGEFDAAVGLSKDFDGAALQRARGLMMRGVTLVALKRPADAISSQRAAVLTASELPAEHPEIGRQLLQLGSLLHAHGQREEGRERLAEGLARIEKAMPGASLAIHNARLINFNAMVLDGDHAQAAVLAPSLMAAFDDPTHPPATRQRLGIPLVRHFLVLNEFPRARQVLETLDRLLPSVPAHMAMRVRLAQARLALTNRDAGQAGERLTEAARLEASLTSMEIKSWEDVRHDLHLHLLLAQSELAQAQGRSADAVDTAMTAVTMSLGNTTAYYTDEDAAEARLRLGRALSAAGDPASASSHLLEAERHYASRHVPASPWLREARAALRAVGIESRRSHRPGGRVPTP